VKGVILAAGEGTRMQSVTYGAFPKELLPIGNVPTIRFPIEAMRLAHVRNILVVIARQTKHGIIDGLEGGKKFDTSICYVVQERNLTGSRGMGQAILSTKDWIEEGQDLVVACGDSILCDFGLSNPLDCLKPLLKIHSSSNALATVLAYPSRASPARFGIVRFASLREDGVTPYGELDDLVEKPDLARVRDYQLRGYYFVIAGYYVFKSKIFQYIEKTEPDANNEVQITDAISLALKKEKVVAVVHGRFEHECICPFDYWDVGIPEEYKAANKRVLEANLESFMI